MPEQPMELDQQMKAVLDTVCHQQGLDYVSCSPFRVPIARLAAAQAALGDG